MMESAEIDKFVGQAAEWLRAKGPFSDIVISSRIRLARNLTGYAFGNKLTPEQHKEIIRIVEQAIEKSQRMKTATVFHYGNLNELDKQVLIERHLVSREHAQGEEAGSRAAAITSNEVVSLMVLEEDHLRIQAFQSGFNLLEAWRIVDKIDDELEKKLSFSYDDKLGYLTACPTNVGTGLRASCMLHLPGLVLTKQVQKVLQALSKLNLAVRGLYGEGTQATGNLFQFSNQITLGQHEDEVIDNLECVIKQVIEHEKEARKYLLDKKKEKFEDQIWRALGSLKTARVITSQEATQLISLLQLGVHQGLIKSQLKHEDLNALFLLVQPGHLQKVAKKKLDAGERDIRRAEVIRERLKSISF